jgi:hypothetical protein
VNAGSERVFDVVVPRLILLVFGTSKSMPGLSEAVGLRIGIDRRWHHREDFAQDLLTAVVMEAAVASRELSSSVPLVRPRRGKPIEDGAVGDLYRITLHHDVHATVPLVAAGKEDDVRIVA